MREIILKNPMLLNAITFFKNKDFNENLVISYLTKLLNIEKIENREILFGDSFILKYNIVSEIDYITLEIFFTFKDENKEFSNSEILTRYKSFGIDFKNVGVDLEIFSKKEYFICSNFLDLNFPDKLYYDIYYKKIDEVRYLYSSLENNEFLGNFLKHIIKFDIYYSKILVFYKKFSVSYPELQKSNLELIKEYSKIIDLNDINSSQSDLNNLTKKVNNLEGISFGLMYDIESLESNLENLESRLKTIGGQESRYFLNHIEKAKFIIETFDSVLKKNNLIKENILKNYIEILKNDLEKQKIDNEKKKINHIKNIKEILGGLAFIEVFINGLSESSKIFEFGEKISVVLENTGFMRMILIVIFVIFYFLYVLVRKIKKP